MHCRINFDDSKTVVITSLSDKKVGSEKQNKSPRILELVSDKDGIKAQVWRGPVWLSG